MKRATLSPLTCAVAATLIAVVAQAATKVTTPAPTHPPLVPVDITQKLGGTEQLDLFLLIGQSNMKGRGIMPDEPANDPRLVMMSIKDDAWYVARHPLHLTGDPKTFKGADNAGVGPGLSFAQTLLAAHPATRIGLIPCAVGGTAIARWKKDAKLYEDALRRARLAISSTAAVGGRLRGVLWLQGEADAKGEQTKVYAAKLSALVDDLRGDLAMPELPFIACTIGEMKPIGGDGDKGAINAILLDLPNHRPHTACVDARDLKESIGDGVHYNAESQGAIGQRFAQKYIQLTEHK